MTSLPSCGAMRWQGSLPLNRARARRAGSGALTALLCWLVACVHAAPMAVTAVGDAMLAGRVTRVIDGDTLDVLLSSGLIRVRLHGIDAPERNQNSGAASTQWLSQRVLNQPVWLEPIAQDQYERLLAIVHLGDSNLNQALVSAGHAWAYRRYLRRVDRDLCTLEYKARAQRQGLWSDGMARAPWEFRATSGKGPFTDFSRSTAADCRSSVRRR
jgi:micrococcal nuclease